MSQTQKPDRSPSVTAVAVSAVLAAVFLAATASSAYAQDAAPAPSQKASEPQPAGSPGNGADAAESTPAASQTATPPTPQTRGSQGDQARASDSQPGKPARGSGRPNGARSSAKPPAVCFKLTGRCVEGSTARPNKGGAAAAPQGGSSAQRPLNLSAPDVRTVVSPDQLKEPVPDNEQITETQEAETVAVKGETEAPDVPGGFGALWWALNHPSQAWRILAPAQ